MPRDRGNVKGRRWGGLHGLSGPEAAANRRGMIIAVDGPSASGKGTLAKAIAARLGYAYLDTGTLYRMVGLLMRRTQTDLSDAKAAAQFAATLDVGSFSDAELRGEVVGGAASKVAVIPAVREALLAVQRTFAAQQPGAVLDGRDIGTVICPDADVKFFITASPMVRARRRYLELVKNGQDISYEEVAADVSARDQRDAARTLVATDAIVIDTSDLGAEAALGAAMTALSAKLGI